MAEGGKKKNKRCETSTVDAPKTKKLKKTKPKDGTMKKTAAQMEYEANLDAYLERFTEFFKDDILKIQSENFDQSIVPLLKDSLETGRSVW
eukprot:CAMPEP_0174362244 /NCGR_PEP_ID=MMETSP0811_2-20130205/63405_1 /TAXON_ID=73025 ORGANISM="Eutreptiella gymnastica-like, Strain CCMP1594" /NCGR_SAMPLE_ID=MMETSP0811_2 /ASSEMBLY_ACC=CAM_ASM_000667 /LENGTH=90 /DNA_ID=CAMNT_0015499729 /DNA_START=16 /DNA_END=285 /DNA_ORIENTATION=+